MQRLVIVTGLSGSGKTAAANCFEDLGYFCVDNLPVTLIPPFCDLIQRGGESVERAALVIDARERDFLELFPPILADLRRRIRVDLLFFECSDDVLKQRFSETRRPHPMARDEGTVEDGIATERQALATLRDSADRIIDTTRFTAHELREFLVSAYSTEEEAKGPRINVLSFGFKRGVPTEADLVFDVRFLPNPYFVPHLKEQDGTMAPVRDFLFGLDLTKEFLARLESFLDFLLPLYEAEGKSYVTVAIGCTGGKHRSVALSCALGQFLEKRGVPGNVRHRDLGQE